VSYDAFFFFGGKLRTGQKLIISLFTTIVLFVVFSFLLYTSFFDFIEINFYKERTLADFRDRTLVVEEGINTFFEDNFTRLDLFFNQSFFRAAQDQTQSSEVISNQFRSADAFLRNNKFPSNSFIRITDLDSRRLFFSTRWDPAIRYAPGNTSDALRRQDFLINYKTIGQLNPAQPTKTEDDQSWSYDPLHKGYWIQGYIRGEDGLPLSRYWLFFPEFHLQQSLFSAKITAGTNELFIVSEDKIGLNYTRVNDIESLVPSILDILQEEQEVLNYLAESEDAQRLLVFSPALRGPPDTFVLFPESTLEITQELEVLILVGLFSIIFLSIFIILNGRVDQDQLIRQRLKRFQVQFLVDYFANADKAKEGVTLASQSERLKNDFKTTLGKLNKGKTGFVDELLEKSWSEIIDIIETKQGPAAQATVGFDVKQLEEALERAFSRIQIPVSIQSGNVVPSVSTNTPGPASVQEVLEGVRKTPSASDLEEVSALDPVEELEEIEEAQAVEELDDGQALQAVEELEEIQEVQPEEELEEIEEAQAVEELDDGQPLQTVEEPEEIQEVKPTEELEEIEEAQAVEELDDGQPLQTVEELEVIQEVQPAEELEEIQPSDEHKDPIASQLPVSLEDGQLDTGKQVSSSEKELETVNQDTIQSSSDIVDEEVPKQPLDNEPAGDSTSDLSSEVQGINEQERENQGNRYRDLQKEKSTEEMEELESYIGIELPLELPPIKEEEVEEITVYDGTQDQDLEAAEVEEISDNEANYAPVERIIDGKILTEQEGELEDVPDAVHELEELDNLDGSQELDELEELITAEDLQELEELEELEELDGEVQSADPFRTSAQGSEINPLALESIRSGDFGNTEESGPQIHRFEIKNFIPVSSESPFVEEDGITKISQVLYDQEDDEPDGELAALVQEVSPPKRKALMPFTLSHIQQVPDMLLNWTEKGIAWDGLFGGWGKGNVQLFKGLTEVTNRLGAFTGAVIEEGDGAFQAIASVGFSDPGKTSLTIIPGHQLYDMLKEKSEILVLDGRPGRSGLLHELFDPRDTKFLKAMAYIPLHKTDAERWLILGYKTFPTDLKGRLSQKEL
jgi:hypothetical protein